MIVSNIPKKGQKLNLDKYLVDIEDSAFLSDYFVLSEFEPKFTSGKNTFLVHGSQNLQNSSPIQIEVLDSNRSSLYVEIAKSNNISYKEGGALRISVYVYNDTPFGVGKITLVGKTKNGKSVRWIGNVQINSSLTNNSKVVFYKSPILEVKPSVVPLNFNSTSTGTSQTISSSVYTSAIVPRKNSDYGVFDLSRQNLDYELHVVDNDVFFSSSMKDAQIELNISELNGDPSLPILNISSSNVISEIVNSKKIKLKNPVYYINKENKKIISDVTSGTFKSTITNVFYDSSYSSNADSSYKQSIAYIKYTNLKTFTGNVYRHKLYRRSLNSPVEFQIIADEVFTPQQLLVDENTPNSFFKNLGSFPNNSHVTHYWLSSSSDVSIQRDATVLMDAMKITNVTSTEHYVIVKNDSEPTGRDYNYVPYNELEVSNQSGSSYDSNFMSFFGDITYKFSFKTNAVKGSFPTGGLGFYITSSMLDEIDGDLNFDSKRGIKIGEVSLDSSSPSLYSDGYITFYNKFNNDFNGTLVIYATNCTADVSDVSISTYSDPSFSPEIYVTKIPFPISVPAEQFEFKSELFDLNSNLVYSNIRTIATFDPNGESFVKYDPGVISSDLENGLKTFNLTISSSNAGQGLHVVGDVTRFDFEASGSIGTTQATANFATKRGVIDISPKVTTDNKGGAVYISPDNGLTIAPTSVVGTINNSSIGATTPSTGKFTTLTVDDTSGNTVTLNPNTTGTINNSSIGATTPSTGKFTTLTVDNTSGNAVTLTPNTTGTIGNVNINSSTIGATTPSTGKFTTLTVENTANNDVDLYPFLVGTIDHVNLGSLSPHSGSFTYVNSPYVAASYITITNGLTVPVTTAPSIVTETVTSTTLASTPGSVDVICPLKTPDGWLLLNGKKIPYYN